MLWATRQFKSFLPLWLQVNLQVNPGRIFWQDSSVVMRLPAGSAGQLQFAEDFTPPVPGGLSDPPWQSAFCIAGNLKNFLKLPI